MSLCSFLTSKYRIINFENLFVICMKSTEVLHVVDVTKIYIVVIFYMKVKVNMCLCLTTETLRHEDVWGS
jgi:hypothetical protein